MTIRPNKRVTCSTCAHAPRAFEADGTKQILLGLVLAAGVMLTQPVMAASPAPVDLGSCSNFAILAYSTITSTGSGSIHGDVGLSPTGSVVLGTTQINGTLHNGDAIAAQAQTDLTAAYNDAAGRSADRITLTDAENIGGRTNVPGLYRSASSLFITGDLTLDAGGDTNAVWIFQMGATLITAAGGAGDPHSRVILAGGAQAQNVFWQVGSSATLGTYSVFKGTIMAQASITMDTGSTIDGRALARTGAVTFDALDGGPTILSISVSPATWAVGTVGTGTVQMISSGHEITVTNNGTVTETFTLAIADQDDRSEWTHSPSKSGAGDRRYVLSGIFCAAADSPTAGSFNQTADNNVLTTSEQPATAIRFAHVEGTATGEAVPANAGRSLWLRLDTPTAGTGGIEHTITVRVGCIQPL